MLSDFDQMVREFFSEGWDGPAKIVRTFSSYNVATSENMVSNQRIDVRVIVFDYVTKADNPNSLVKTGDKQVIMLPSQLVGAINPTSDKFEMNNIIYKIITQKEMNPNGAGAIYHELFVRA